LNKTGKNIPVLIGGATTSRAHTAVKIAPQYTHTVVHVNDASRAVTVVGNLLKPDSNKAIQSNIKSEYDDLRERFQQRSDHKTYVPVAEAREKRLRIDFKQQPPSTPKHWAYKFWSNLQPLVDYIDWTPFFRSWDLHGRYPEILTDQVVGTEATQLFADAKAMLQQIIDGKLLKAKAVYWAF
jgi:5-methyltetrahydrofolate--homocysteine methyltransferase